MAHVLQGSFAMYLTRRAKIEPVQSGNTFMKHAWNALVTLLAMVSLFCAIPTTLHLMNIVYDAQLMPRVIKTVYAVKTRLGLTV